MKIYTRGGDGGKTSLSNGERVSKADRRIEAHGELDELNSLLGYLAALLAPEHEQLAAELRTIQSGLFRLGSWLAETPGTDAADALAPLNAGGTSFLEQAIDRMDRDLTPLRGFILPGGHPTAALAHVARTVCRRAERRAVRLLDQEPTSSPTGQEAVVYLNRLSDYLFVLARTCNRLYGVEDVPWDGES